MSQADEPDPIAEAHRRLLRAGLLARSRRLLERGDILAHASAKLIATSRRLLHWRRARRADSPGPDPAEPEGPR
jgi:hypothetical protein